MIKLLTPEFGQVGHVDCCGLPAPVNNTETWNWAKDNDAMIITNDEDYYYYGLAIRDDRATSLTKIPPPNEQSHSPQFWFLVA
ncbi:MAG: DUF5615 family PIN-like protein [Lewinellaceae bacterium]|nr:DUF5615 family PIN-like protein [Phaeodactylibacter sp.]MCB9348827.1 DUF5615 family PIN-like protein [Lewinellaceae bacterium]